MRHTHEEFIQNLKDRQPAIFELYTILGNYYNNSTKIKVQCNVCGVVVMKNPSKLLIGRGCQNCRLLGEDEINSRLAEIQPNAVVAGIDFTKSTRQVVEYTCEKNHTSKKQLRKVLEGIGCPVCCRESYKKEHEIMAKLAKYPHVRIAEGSQYINCVTKMDFICEHHGAFSRDPFDLHDSVKFCPKCSTQTLKFHNSTIAERYKDVYEKTASNVYLIHLESIGYKIGISQKPKDRFTNIKRESGKSLEVIALYPMDLYSAIAIEDLILDKFGTKYIDSTFAGYTEILNCDDEDTILEFITSLIKHRITNG